MKKIKIFMLMVCLIMCFSSITLAANFYDIKGTKYEGVVDRVARLGIINGMSETAFAPNKSITRAELAKMIVYTKGLKMYADTSEVKSTFKDTKGHWAESYIATAADLELLKGYSDGTFRPDKEVSYAEVAAIVLRGLGYVNIDETEGSTWYFGYIKRMFELELDEGVEDYKSYEEPIKRGDVAMIWWNMLISDRWVIQSETDGSGLYYTYSDKPQLEVLFPGYYAINGKITSISDGDSGDKISVYIDGRRYQTDSEVQIYSVGAIATGVCDEDEGNIYGLSIDESLAAHKVVSGPIFYLEKQGYSLKKAKNQTVLGSKSKANYAYLLVSKETNEVLRSVLVDASASYYVDNIKVEEDKEDNDDESVKPFAEIFLNDSEERFTTNNAVIIKNGKRTDWEDLEEDVIITELIPGRLFTYEDKVINGKITDHSDLEELYIDEDKYIVSENCLYTIFGEYADEDEKALKVFDYGNLSKTKLEELLVRNIDIYLNAAEEISFIKFGKYRPSSIIDKYDNGNSRFFYITSISHSSGDDTINVGGRSLGGNRLKYTIPSDEIAYNIGDFVVVSEIEGKYAEKIELIDSDVMFEDDDISILYDCEDEFYNNAFGEYNLIDETIIFRVDKYYENNSNEKIEEYALVRMNTIQDLGNLKKYKMNLFCNNDMEVEIIFAEREINRTTYPVGRVVSIEKIKDVSLEDDGKKDYIPIVNVKITTIGGGIDTFEMLSGDCEVGELVTYEVGEKGVDIKERFKIKFLGYENDVIIESFDEETKKAKVKNNSQSLNLVEDTFNFKGKEINLLEYKYVFIKVRKDGTTKNWKFTGGEFCQKEELELEPGDRIAFGELNGVAIVYRGWQD